MTFLPIVERELRVAARKHSTIWLRLSAALTGLLIGGAILLCIRLGAFGMVAPGLMVFRVLTWMALAAALAAGPFFTSNSLSDEKREGTLGFLFLTNLRGYDVAAGKLAATSLRAFYGLLAIFPVLAFTFLFGGVGNSQFWEIALALVNVLFCSLTAGLLISALSRDSQKALAGTVGFVLVLALAGPCVDGIVSDRTGRSFRPFLSTSSPVYVFTAAWNQGGALYWRGLGVSQLLSWGMLALTCLLLPRTWQERERRLGRSRWLLAFKYGSQRRRSALRRKWLLRHPICWLRCRERWQAIVLWAVLVLVTGGYAGDVAARGFQRAWNDAEGLCEIITLSLYLWAAAQAAVFLCEARRSGFLELLLATPLSIGQVITGQWRACLRLYALPVVGLFILRLVAASGGKVVSWGAVTLQSGGGQIAQGLVSSAISAVSSTTDLIALGWFGMWMGMTSKHSTLATFKTIISVQVIPWLIIVLSTVLGLAASWMLPILRSPTRPAWLNLWLPVGVSGIAAGLMILKDIGFVIWSRRRLYSAFRKQASEGSGASRLAVET